MRILHIIDTLDPAAGGPSDSLRNIVSSYPAMGHEGEVLCQDLPDAPFLKTMPFKVHALGPRRSTFGHNPRLIPWMRENRSRFQGAVIDGLWTYSGFAAWRAFHKQLPYVVFPHGMLDPYFKRAYPFKHVKKWFYWLAAQYWVLRDAHCVLFTTSSEAELAKQSFWLHRWTPLVVPYGATSPTGDPDAMRRAFFAHCPAVADRPYLLFLGRIHPKKGCDLLVEAFARTASRHPGLQLVIAGPDQTGSKTELTAQAKRLGIASRIHWPGMLHGDLKWGAFFGCEAFVLPSHQENFGIAVAEALACGKPALLSDKVNIAADIRAAGAALVEPDTLEGTHRLLDLWMDIDAAGRAQMSANALACFHANYDMKENAKAIIRIFEDVTHQVAL